MKFSSASLALVAASASIAIGAMPVAGSSSKGVDDPKIARDTVWKAKRRNNRHGRKLAESDDRCFHLYNAETEKYLTWTTSTDSYQTSSGGFYLLSNTKDHIDTDDGYHYMILQELPPLEHLKPQCNGTGEVPVSLYSPGEMAYMHMKPHSQVEMNELYWLDREQNGYYLHRKLYYEGYDDYNELDHFTVCKTPPLDDTVNNGFSIRNPFCDELDAEEKEQRSWYCDQYLTPASSEWSSHAQMLQNPDNAKATWTKEYVDCPVVHEPEPGCKVVQSVQTGKYLALQEKNFYNSFSKEYIDALDTTEYICFLELSPSENPEGVDKTCEQGEPVTLKMKNSRAYLTSNGYQAMLQADGYTAYDNDASVSISAHDFWWCKVPVAGVSDAYSFVDLNGKSLSNYFIPKYNLTALLMKEDPSDNEGAWYFTDLKETYAYAKTKTEDLKKNFPTNPPKSPESLVLEASGSYMYLPFYSWSDFTQYDYYPYIAMMSEEDFFGNYASDIYHHGIMAQFKERPCDADDENAPSCEEGECIYLTEENTGLDVQSNGWFHISSYEGDYKGFCKVPSPSGKANTFWLGTKPSYDDTIRYLGLDTRYSPHGYMTTISKDQMESEDYAEYVEAWDFDWTFADPPTGSQQRNGGAHGDPHITTWSGQMYDFHGGCDLVLLANPDFGNGLGLNIHIRTAIKTWWSYIETAVVEIGGNVLEIKGGDKSISYWINGGERMELETGNAALGDFPVHFRRVNEHQSQNRIDLDNSDAISIETFKHFVRVNVHVHAKSSETNPDKFKGSVGLMGSFPEGEFVARDGSTIMEDHNEFGKEWQVLDSEPKLFHSVEGTVQHPEQCTMPDTSMKSKERRRRLGMSGLTEEVAALACGRVSEAERDACIFDVLATNDLEMAGSY